MKYGKFKRNYQPYYDKIITFYKEGEHTNFASFLKKIVNNKNVVYTFSNKMEKINVPNEKIIKSNVYSEIKNPNNESFVCCIQMNNFLLAGDSDNSIFQFEINKNSQLVYFYSK